MTEILAELALSLILVFNEGAANARIEAERKEIIETRIEEECAPLPPQNQIDCLVSVLQCEEIADHVAQ